ncbi:MAG: 50S ribosomal protein L18 [Aigarchaeota archaeon]|nr:50S ribosomal protein L18 [Aigarchaeota archaeon]MDW8092554.1 50S ribosomal protein L18 [Nitrososphaerota archaeon]
MPRDLFYRRFPPRRRREGKTDYRGRLRLVKSGKPRLVVRRSNRYITVMTVRSKAGGDETIVSVNSKQLSKYGWQLGTKSVPAAYLTGYLAAKLSLKKGVRDAVADIGIHKSTRGSRVFAAIKGAIDAGLNVPMGEGVAPGDERLRGQHIAEYGKIVESLPQSHQFSRTKREVLRDASSHFEEVRGKLDSVTAIN